MKSSELLNLVQQLGVVSNGHFVLSSGRHSDEYWEKFRLLEWPRVTEQLCREIAFCIDGVYGTNLDACRAIDALIRVNDELVIQFVEAGDGAHFHAVGKLASVAFLGDDVGHRIRVLRVG